MKEMQKVLRKDRPKLQPESIFIANFNDETRTSIAITTWLLKTQSSKILPNRFVGKRKS